MNLQTNYELAETAKQLPLHATPLRPAVAAARHGVGRVGIPGLSPQLVARTAASISLRSRASGSSPMPATTASRIAW